MGVDIFHQQIPGSVEHKETSNIKGKGTIDPYIRLVPWEQDINKKPVQNLAPSSKLPFFICST